MLSTEMSDAVLTMRNGPLGTIHAISSKKMDSSKKYYSFYPFDAILSEKPY